MSKKQGASGDGRLPRKEFVLRAIHELASPNPICKKNGGKNYGIHLRCSGFNLAFRAYYGEGPEETLRQLEAEGVILIVLRERRLGTSFETIYDAKNISPSFASGGAGHRATLGLQKILKTKGVQRALHLEKKK